MANLRLEFIYQFMDEMSASRESPDPAMEYVKETFHIAYLKCACGPAHIGASLEKLRRIAQG